MRIGLYHGYELHGSGSNEYTRYVARYLVEAGHEVHIICREENPATIPFVTRAYAWDVDGAVETLFADTRKMPACYVHQLPYGPVHPVYLTDKQRTGNIKSFTALTDAELRAYHTLNERLLFNILSSYRLDGLHANHLVYQPVAALEPCRATGTPLIVYPHGSAIEYTVKADKRYLDLALTSLLGCAGLIIGNREVRDRILALYPQHQDALLAKTRIVGVGVDTSLFQPVAKSDRTDAIQQLIATQGGGGKTPELTTELQTFLQHGDLEATRRYWNSYQHALPDADLNEHLMRIPWDQRILLFVGALTVGKGIHSVITALPTVLDRHPDVHFIIVGAGAYREVLEGLVYALSTSQKTLLLRLCEKGMDLDRNELSGPWEDVQAYLTEPGNLEWVLDRGKGLEKHVHFVGRLDHSRLRYLFPCADFAIFPSVVPEAYPLVVMESLANGVLPLVSYFSGFKDSVDDLCPLLGKRVNELMKIPVDSQTRVTTIASHLNALFADEVAGRLSPTLRQIAVDNYDWALKAQQMIAAYQSLI